MSKNVTVKIKIKKHNVLLFLEMAKIMIENTKQEKGNISYTLYNEYNDPSSFVFLEEFLDLEAFDYHLNTDYYKEFVKKLTPLLIDEPIVKSYFDNK